MATPFKLKSGNTPDSRTRVESFVRGLFGGLNTAKKRIEKGTQKFGDDVEKTVKKVTSTVNPGRKRGGSKRTKTKRRAGESQYQANIRARRETSKTHKTHKGTKVDLTRKTESGPRA
jgi:hypothetical protein